MMPLYFHLSVDVIRSRDLRDNFRDDLQFKYSKNVNKIMDSCVTLTDWIQGKC